MIIARNRRGRSRGSWRRMGLRKLARVMVLRMVLAFIGHRGELMRYPARPRWQKHEFNGPLRTALLPKESKRGEFIFLFDDTPVGRAE